MSILSLLTLASESDILMKIGGILVLKFGSLLSFDVSASLYKTEKQFDNPMGVVMRLSAVVFALQRRLGKINHSSLYGEPSISLGPGVRRWGWGVRGGFRGLERVWLDPGWGRAWSGWMCSGRWVWFSQSSVPVELRSDWSAAAKSVECSSA